MHTGMMPTMTMPNAHNNNYADSKGDGTDNIVDNNIGDANSNDDPCNNGSDGGVGTTWQCISLANGADIDGTKDRGQGQRHQQ